MFLFDDKLTRKHVYRPLNQREKVQILVTLILLKRVYRMGISKKSKLVYMENQSADILKNKIPNINSY